MKALDYLDMPDYVPVTHEVVMEPAERKLYEQMKEDLLVHAKGEEIDAANAAVLSGKLLQMANGAIYTDAGEIVTIHDKKLDMLEDLMPRNPQYRANLISSTSSTLSLRQIPP